MEISSLGLFELNQVIWRENQIYPWRKKRYWILFIYGFSCKLNFLVRHAHNYWWAQRNKMFHFFFYQTQDFCLIRTKTSKWTWLLLEEIIAYTQIHRKCPKTTIWQHRANIYGTHRVRNDLNLYRLWSRRCHMVRLFGLRICI